MSRRHRGTRADREKWWATLEPDALRDEIREHRRVERRLLALAGLAMAITLTILVLRGVFV